MPRNIPWDRVRGEVLRSLIKELGLKDYNKLKREQMIELLEEMETEGFEAVVAQQGSPPPGSPPKSAIKRRRSNEPSTILGLSSKRQTTSSRRKSRRSLRPAPSFQIIDSNVAFDCVLIPPTSFKGKIKTRRTILRTSETPQPSVKETNEDYQEGEEFNVVYQEDEVEGEALELDEREEELSRGRSFRGKFKTYKSRRSHSQRSSSVSSSVV